MWGDLSSHHLSFNSSYVLVYNHASVNVFTTTSFPSVSLIGIAGGSQQPWNYLNNPVLLSYWWCLLNAVLLCVERRIPSTSSPGCSSPSHHNFPVASAIQHGQMDRVLWAELKSWRYSGTVINDKSQGLISLAVPYILKMEGEHGSWENALHNLIERSVWKFSSFVL